MQVIQSFTIDGLSAELATFAMPEMSLSSARAHMTAHDFAIRFNIAPLADLLTPAYEILKNELKNDDVIIGGPRSALAVAGYPFLRQCLREPVLALEILDFLFVDSLRDQFWNGLDTVRYWFDRSVRCQIDGDITELLGICYSNPVDLT